MNPSDSTIPSAIDQTFVDELIDFVSDEISDEPVVGETDLLLTGLVDSLGVVMIVDWIEQRLVIDIDPGDVVLEHFRTIDAMAAYLRSRADVAVSPEP